VAKNIWAFDESVEKKLAKSPKKVGKSPFLF
jgi:hypothetical protein